MKLLITISVFLLTGGVMMIPSAHNSTNIAGAGTYCKYCKHFHSLNADCTKVDARTRVQ